MAKGEDKEVNTRSTDIDAAKRLDEIINLLLSGGVTFRDVRIYCEKSGWGIADSAIHAYYVKAKAAILEMSKESREQEFANTYVRLNDLYRRALLKGDLNTCRNILMDLARLFGLDTIRIQVDSAIKMEIANLTRQEVTEYGDKIIDFFGEKVKQIVS